MTVCALAGTAAKVALAAGLPAALLCYGWRARTARAAALVSVLVAISAPLTFARLERVSDLVVTADAVKFSAAHRLLIWSFVGDRIAEHPLAGWGLNSSRAIPGGKDPIEPGASWLPLHPHNAPLQLWLELGVPGAVLLALLAAYAWLALARAEWPRRFGRGGRRQSRDRVRRHPRDLRDLGGMVAGHLMVLAVPDSGDGAGGRG